MPHADIFDSLGDRSSVKGQNLGGIEAHLEDVVQQGEERGQREGSNEDGHEAVLQHCYQIISNQFNSLEMDHKEELLPISRYSENNASLPQGRRR